MNRLPRRKVFVFAATAALLGVIGTTGALLAVDLYLHRTIERSGGVNRWGYRGPVLGRKAAQEFRIAVLGGSSAYGYGVLWSESFPHVLELALNARERGSGRTYRVANLGYPNEAAYSFKFTIEDYDYLDFDMYVLYEGYNDLGDEPRYQVYRRDSPVFRLTGYLPVFPVMFREKAFAMLNGGDIAQGYRDILGQPKQTVFRPGMATQVGAAALQAAADTAVSLEQQLGKLTRDRTELQEITPSAGCTERWQHYCGAQRAAIGVARASGASVLVVSQPYISDKHVEQQLALMGMVQEHFGRDPGVATAAMAHVDLKDSDIAFDGMHLSPAGNRLVGEALASHVLGLAARAPTRP
jgi:hypothetical protein